MNKYQNRSRILFIMVALVGFIFLLRLFYLQVIAKNYKLDAEENAVRKEVVYPARGLIYDRHGKILVRNNTIYDVMVIPSQVKDLDTLEFCRLLEVDAAEFKSELAKAKEYSRYKPSPIVRQITSSQYGRFQERMFEFRGFFVQARTMRTYPLGIASHAIGYLGEVSDDEIAADPEGYYRMGDYIGKAGLEKSYEKYLRGKKGTRLVLVDVLNRVQGHYADGKFDRQAVPGKDLITGLDLKMQEYAEKLMAGKKGSVVALDPKTGEVLCMVSSPTYDPNLLLGRYRAKNYSRLLLDPDKPMFNRAISAAYPPGSTIKPVEAIIGLHDKVLSPQTTFNCPGGYHVGSHLIRCHSTGTFNLHAAIQQSCNTYFCYVFKMLMEEDRFDSAQAALVNWSGGLAKMGEGIRLGVDIPGEGKGIVPTPQYYNRFFGKNWKASTVMSLGIGQAEISLTPIQLATAAATIANRGYYVAPHFVRAIAVKDSIKYLPTKRIESGIDTNIFGIVIPAMEDVVQGGTATMAKINGITICGKTGTAQNPHGKNHALFMCFAPRDTPKIAMAVVVENAGYGGTWAAPIASLLIEKYLKDTVSRPKVEDWILKASYLGAPDTEEEKADHKHKTQKVMDNDADATDLDTASASKTPVKHPDTKKDGKPKQKEPSPKNPDAAGLKKDGTLPDDKSKKPETKP